MWVTDRNTQNYGRNFYTGVHCLKVGKRTYSAVDQAQQTDTQDSDNANKKGALRCIECHYVITHQSDRIQVNEQHRHVFANPHGYVYRIGCFGRAPGCLPIGQASSHFSWFPGYTWQVALCGQCLTLLGWAFRSSEAYFFGLIVEKLK